MEETGQKTVLLVSAMSGAENLAATLSHEAHVPVQVARNLRSTLAALRRAEFGAVLVDTGTISEETVELIWQRSGLAANMEMRLEGVGATKIIREVSSVMQRREREAEQARREATHALQDEFRQELTGLLLQTELMMREPSMPPSVERKVRVLHDLTDALRVRLRNA
ncbi:MAG: hypothetical protein JSS87_03665 [Acidobacteria bacterium]|nr:hypothetical protein [Acidobacteriota bacterium]